MTLITTFGVLALASLANAHGYLTIPKSRVRLGYEVSPVLSNPEKPPY